MTKSISKPYTPLKFFRIFFLEDGFKSFQKEFEEYWTKREEDDYENVTYFYLLDYAIFVKSVNEFNEKEWDVVFFADELKNKLESEYQNSLGLLMDTVSKIKAKFNTADVFLNEQVLLLDEIYKTKFAIFKAISGL